MSRSFVMVALVLVLFATPKCDAQGRFFWSDKGFGQGAHPDDGFVDAQVGEEKQIFLYYQTLDQDISDGFVFDFSLDPSGVFNFTAASTLNFNITIGGIPIETRWDDTLETQVQDNSIQFFGAGNTAAQGGILQSNTGPVFLDEGYDFSADAFLVGSITVLPLGSAFVELQYDLAQVADDGQLINPILGDLGIFAGGCQLSATNDLWVDSDEITISDFPSIWGGTNGFTFTEPDEQQLENTGSTVWFHWTAPEDGILSVDTQFSDFNTQLHIYTGAELGFPNLIPITNNDDVNGTGQSRVSFPVESGQRYEIRVGGFCDGTGGGGKNDDGEEGCIVGMIDYLENALPGDVNCDGSVDLLDVTPFVERLINETYDPKADVNFDGELNLLDVDPFVVLLSG